MENRWEYECALEKLDRTIKRLWVLCIILIFCFVSSNLAWFIYESQWQVTEDVSKEITQEISTDGGGDAIINDGVHINGESETNN